MHLKYDPNVEDTRGGWGKVLRLYEELALKYVIGIGEEGSGSGKVWERANELLQPYGKTISRASIIFFLNRMVDEDILDFRDATGKGGHHRVYFSKVDESGFKEHVARKFVKSLLEDWPEETIIALAKLNLDVDVLQFYRYAQDEI